MTDYVRMLSYIYLYDDDRKVSNTGFVKMDGRDGIVKILVNIRLPYRNDLRKLDLVVYNEEDGEIIPTHIGELRLLNGSGQYKGHIKSDVVAHSIGMKIHAIDEGEDLQFASYFKDTEINILKIKPKVTIEEPMEEPIYNNIPLEAKSIEVASCGYEEPEFFERMSRQYCKCRVFGEEYQCIRISDRDICGLPEECGSFRNNSFFMQAAYFYKHILLIKCLADSTYYIGVPGCYQKNEKNAAELFGFSQFLYSKDKITDCANCGYWIAKIDI